MTKNRRPGFARLRLMVPLETMRWLNHRALIEFRIPSDLALKIIMTAQIEDISREAKLKKTHR